MMFCNRQAIPVADEISRDNPTKTILCGWIHKDACDWLGVEDVRMEIDDLYPSIKRNAVYGDHVFPRIFYRIYFTWKIDGDMYGTSIHPYFYVKKFANSIPHPRLLPRLFGFRLHGIDWELDFDGIMLDLREIVVKARREKGRENRDGSTTED